MIKKAIKVPGDALIWKGRRITLTQLCLIGRGEDNDVVLEDKKVSRRHAMICRQGDDWWLSDLGSRNGIRVNGIRLAHARRLREGDELEMGAQTLRFVSMEAEDQRTAAHLGGTTEMSSDARHTAQAIPLLCELIVATSSGEILEGEKVARWFFGDALERPQGMTNTFLPSRVCTWLGRQTDAGSMPCSPELELLDTERRVIVNLCRCKEGRYFLLVREESAQASRERLLVMGLSPREAEVMLWVCEGKTNPEIATILEVTVHTINRHVEHILAKLGVENRQKAMVTVLEKLRL